MLSIALVMWCLADLEDFPAACSMDYCGANDPCAVEIAKPTGKVTVKVGSPVVVECMTDSECEGIE